MIASIGGYAANHEVLVSFNTLYTLIQLNVWFASTGQKSHEGTMYADIWINDPSELTDGGIKFIQVS